MRVIRQNLCGQIILGVILACAAQPCLAQNGKLQLQNLEKLSAKAAEVNDVTLDGALLQLAAKFLDAEGDSESREIKEMVRNLKGIYVKNFAFDEPNQYSQADVEAIRTQLAAPGWQRIVTSHNKRTHENNEVYLLKEGEKVTGVAILVAEARELTVVNIVGPIDFDKLGKLGGHFGIPDEINDHPTNKKEDGPKARAEKSEKKEAAGEKK